MADKFLDKVGVETLWAKIKSIFAKISDVETHTSNTTIHITSNERTAWNAKISNTEKGIANGVATLDNTGRVPESQLPSFVDDVLEYDSIDNFPAVGDSGKIYIDTSTNMTYRWSGTQYTATNSSLALGETDSTAYRGDRGKSAYDHSLISGADTIHHTHANKSVLDGITAQDVASWDSAGEAIANKVDKTTTINGKSLSSNVTLNKSDIGLSNVDNTSDMDKPVSIAVNSALDNYPSRDLDLSSIYSFDNDEYIIIGEAKILYGCNFPIGAVLVGTFTIQDNQNFNSGDYAIVNFSIRTSGSIPGSLIIKYIDVIPTLNNINAERFTLCKNSEKFFILYKPIKSLNNRFQIKWLSRIDTGLSYVIDSGNKGNLRTLSNAEVSSMEKFPIYTRNLGSSIKPLYIENGTFKECDPLTKASVGLENVDNTSDADKPISTATQTALNNKVDKVTGKGLSTNDFTNEYKTKVDDNTTARHTHENKTVLDGINTDKVTEWNSKQDALTFDDTPTEDSTNPVTSDGVYNSIESEATARAEADTALQTSIDWKVGLVNGLKGVDVIEYCVCNNLEEEANKTITLNANTKITSDLTKRIGMSLKIKFINGSYSSNTKLTISDSDSSMSLVPIYPTDFMCDAGDIHEFVFDGTNFVLLTPTRITDEEINALN